MPSWPVRPETARRDDLSQGVLCVVVDTISVNEAFFPSTGMPDRDGWAVLWPDANRIIRQLGIEPSMRVVDLCCGGGDFTAPLAELVDGRVYALDIDPEMLNQARSEVTRRKTIVRAWVCADARDIAELIPHDCNYVLIANTFHGVPDEIASAKSVAQALKPGGRFAIVNWRSLAREQTTVLEEPRGPKTDMHISPEQVRAVVEPAGFQLTDLVEVPPYHYGVVFQKTHPERALPRMNWVGKELKQ